MEPVFFDGCFGWFHPAAGRRGVVMCGPLGQEADFVHRSWRRLAEMLAEAGWATLRFDYRGQGDSSEAPAIDQVAAWIDDVGHAVAWLKRRQGLDQVVLVGVRFGALAAAAAAAELGGVDGMALLAPVTSGRAYRRELTMMAKMGHKPAPREGEGLNVGGVTYSPESQTSLAALEPFREGGPLAPRVLTLVPPGLPLDRVLAERLAGSAIQATQAEFTDYAALMVEADFSIFPAQAFGRIIDWIGAAAGVAADQDEPAVGAELDVVSGCESAVSIDGSSRLFGILTKPKAPRSGAPAFVFLSTGAIRHTGSGRIAVVMARRLAAGGLTSLRFDVAGVGDSPDRAGQRNPIEHLADGFADVAAALDWLQAQGFAEVVLVGFCRGAQFACNMAFRDRRIRGQILVAPPPYFWSDEPAHRAPNTNRRYLTMLQDRSTWSAIVTGKIRPAQLVRGGFRAISRILATAVAKNAARAVAARLRSLKRAGVETLLLYGDKDEFLLENEDYFAFGRAQFSARLDMDTVVLSGIDHQYYEAGQRRLIVEAIVDRVDGDGRFVTASETPPRSEPRSVAGAETPAG